MHDNQTGAYVSVFKATWCANPDVEPFFHMGNMKHALDVYSAKGKLVRQFKQGIATTPAVTGMHPTKPTLVAGAAGYAFFQVVRSRRAHIAEVSLILYSFIQWEGVLLGRREVGVEMQLALRVYQLAVMCHLYCGQLVVGSVGGNLDARMRNAGSRKVPRTEYTQQTARKKTGYDPINMSNACTTIQSASPSPSGTSDLTMASSSRPKADTETPSSPPPLIDRLSGAPGPAIQG